WGWGLGVGGGGGEVGGGEGGGGLFLSFPPPPPRCYLATQHEAVATSILERFADDVAAHVDGRAADVEPALIAELVDISDGKATFDEHHLAKQPDWTFDEEYSGQSPADRFAEHRDHQAALEE
ncbi:MAG: hypothetical protein ACR2HY_07170, partial [Acidimicrobiales bacterium]